MEIKVEVVMQRPSLSSYSSPRHPLDLFFYSTPSSPKEACSYYLDDDVSLLSHHQTTKKEACSSSDNSDFDFSGQLDRMVQPSLSSADELFDGGKIRPLKPPTRLHYQHNPSSPKMISKASSIIEEDEGFVGGRGRGRGRGRYPNNNNNNNNNDNGGRKGMSRSLSPLRVSEFALLSQQQQEEEDRNNSEFRSSSSKKWRLKDLFLFRSASEGRPKKYSFLSRRISMDSKNSSFRSSTSGSVSSKPRGGQQPNISAHEMHYTANRAVSDELKKKTSLPYRHGLLGWMLKFKSNP